MDNSSVFNHKLPMSGPRVLVGSNYNDQMPLYNALSYEFCRIVAETSSGTVAAPDASPRNIVQNLSAMALATATRALNIKRPTRLQPITVDDDYDLFFYVCMDANHLPELQSMRGWRQRCRKAAAFLFETWSSQLERERRHLKLLDEFDHVFLFNRASVPNVQSFTSAPCSFLSAGADCLLASPYPDSPERVIDVYSMGRRSESTHLQFLEMARRSEIFYVFDAGSGLRVYDFGEARFLTLNYIKRSRYFVAYNHSVGPKAKQMAGEEALPARIFEGAAGGAVMIGSAPRCPEFDELFNWPDAIIEIPVEPEDISSILRELDSDPERLQRASFMNATQSLRRHDWVYRWEHVLTSLGFDPPPGVLARKAALTRLAEAAEAHEPRFAGRVGALR
jgi:Glycosyl transferases group 1